jgi:ATP-dependent Clp protease ATP-binding subunit ClpX
MEHEPRDGVSPPPTAAPAYVERPGRAQVAERVAGLRLLRPTVCHERLAELGYRGQMHARRAASVMAYRHVRRLQRIFLESVPVEELPPRDNYLFIGPTGCGKTYLAELLFRDILEVPSITVDITQYSETGYIGEDVNMILSRLFEAAGEDLAWAACGVVCIDEFDKLASSRSNARFAGEGTTKDVSGFGVQRGLLTLLGGQEAAFPADFGYAHLGPKLTLPLAGLTFIACGAFSGLKTTADALDGEERIGFGRDAKPLEREQIAATFDDRVLEQTAAFSRYGFLPELVGRFSRVVSFNPLDEGTLRQILADSVVRDYEREFAAEDLELEVSDGVLGHIVRRALKRELGARGLRAALVPYLEEAAYEHFGSGDAATIRLELVGDTIEVRSR